MITVTKSSAYVLNAVLFFLTNSLFTTLLTENPAYVKYTALAAFIYCLVYLFRRWINS